MTKLRADTLGVFGGMGPLSTADFIRKVTQCTQTSVNAEHIPMIVLSAPDIPARGGGRSCEALVPLPCPI